MRHALLAVAAWALLGGCAGLHENPYYDPAKPHHTPTGFRNTDAAALKTAGFWRWQWERRTAGLPKPPGPAHRDWRVAPDLAVLRAPNANPSVTWIGHATLLVRLGELNVLTDPHFSERASPVGFAGPKRHLPPGVSIEDLPDIHVVVISHSHYDHLDVDSVRRLHARYGERLRFLVPLGLKPWFTERGIENVTELDWWDHADVGDVRFTLTPAQHWSARGLFDRNQTLWGGWAMRAPEFNLLFTGDTGYTREFVEIGRRLGPFDLAAIPIGAYAPRWFMRMQHVDPAEAVRIHRDVGARQSVGVHWGTFEMSDESLDAPQRELAEARAAAGVAEADFFVLKIGETRRFRN